MAQHHSAQLGLVGGGIMAEAILSRLFSQALYPPDEVMVSDISVERRHYLQEQYGVRVTDQNAEVAQAAAILLLAIKPQVFETVVGTLGPTVHSPDLVLSILAGVPLARLEAVFPDRPLIRAMPNTPATVGAGITALAAGRQVQAENLTTAERLFGAVGKVVVVPEALMDAVTGLSGSGPGFVAIALEALTDGGVAVGLPRAIATQLALQTMRGTVELLATTDLHPAQLKDQVTSPGGTTIAGVTALERAGFRSALIEAVKAAYGRAQELGRASLGPGS